MIMAMLSNELTQGDTAHVNMEETHSREQNLLVTRDQMFKENDKHTHSDIKAQCAHHDDELTHFEDQQNKHSQIYDQLSTKQESVLKTLNQ
jgi:hypothetical protein